MSISETADCEFSFTKVFQVYTEWCGKKTKTFSEQCKCFVGERGQKFELTGRLQ